MQKYCYRCMRPLGSGAFCPQCGFDNGSAPVAAASYHLPRGTVLAERYLVGNVIGEGGFGITYIGLDATLSKRVAVKEFYPAGAVSRNNAVSGQVMITPGKEDFFGRGVERFLLEAKNIAAFSEEEGVVYVLDYFQANGTAYIVMEYLEGETLKDYVNRRGRFAPEQLITLMLPVMRSLGAMHAQGIIHRDISPDNIMLTTRGKLKLMDFGSARYYTNAEREMSVILKQGFAPEEQYRPNGRQGPYTDVYGLCATMYACITGTVPVSSMDRLANDTLRAPSQIGVPMQPYQERALMHGLALYGENRTPNMEMLIHEFTTPYAPQQGVWQQPPVQPVKKSKAPLIIALIAAVVLIGGGIVAAIIAFGGNKGNNPVPLNSLTIPESSAAATTQAPPNSTSAATEPQSSAEESQPSESSAAPTSQPESSEVPAEAHALKDERGTVLVQDDRINTADAAAEQALRAFMSGESSDPSTDEFTYSYFVSGNALVLQYRYVIDLNSEQTEKLKEAAAKMQTNEQIKGYRATVRQATGVADPQLIYAYYTADGDVITVVMVD